MYDFWIGDINIAPILLIITFIVIFPVQLALCFKGKSKSTRLLPVIILAVLTVAAIIASAVCTGYEIIFFIVSAIYLAIMLFVCGVAWGIWAILRFIKKKTVDSKPTKQI